MIQSLLGLKQDMSQIYDEEGKRLSVTKILIEPNVVVGTRGKKGKEKWRVQLGLGEKKIKKAGLEKPPRFMREVEGEGDTEEIEARMGKRIEVSEVFKVGDKVQVTGITKGKGFAGGVKRWGFKGGPRTHGQSDRERAPGSIGRGTTPGHVVRGKKMAGRTGKNRKTIKGLQVVEIDEKEDVLTVSGTIPGNRKGLVIVKKLV